MAASVPPDPATPGRRTAWSTIGALIACVGLALWAYCGYGAWRGLAALGTNCGDEDSRAFCQPATYRVIEWAPLVGALTGLAVTVVGCWIWPRRNRLLWVTIGYVVAVIGLAVGVSLGSGG